jgi:hypothetical protein
VSGFPATQSASTWSGSCETRDTWSLQSAGVEGHRIFGTKRR